MSAYSDMLTGETVGGAAGALLAFAKACRPRRGRGGAAGRRVRVRYNYKGRATP